MTTEWKGLPFGERDVATLRRTIIDLQDELEKTKADYEQLRLIAVGLRADRDYYQARLHAALTEILL